MALTLIAERREPSGGATLDRDSAGRLAPLRYKGKNLRVASMLGFRFRRILSRVVVGGLVAWPAGAGYADTLVLRTGGVVQGEWVNRAQRTPDTYVVRTTSGGEVRLEADRVARVVRQKPAEIEYEQLAPTYADTVADQWQLAQWCREHQLPAAREAHLRRILELDERYAPAWYQLGYTQIGGKWQRQADVNRQHGYEYQRGRWRLAQEAELLEERAKVKAAENDWKKRIHELREAAGSPGRMARVRAALDEIRDPHAVPALVAAYGNDRRRPLRFLLMQAITRIDSPAARNAMLQAALQDPDPEIFHLCVERLEAIRPPDLVDALVKALSSDRNAAVNRAAYMLGRLGDRSAILPLIDALVTRHWQQISPGGGSTSYSASFARSDAPSDGPPGAGLSKSEPQWIEVRLHNQDVLDALVKLSRGANFSFSTQAWRVWYAAQQQRPAPSIDSRRDTSQTAQTP